MFVEADAIPYEPARLRGERLLVLAPHPDDEVIGCGGLVAQHLRDGRAVRIVVVTDGAAANAGAVDREEESRRGIARLGEATVDFLGLPDRGLDSAVASRLREILLEFRPDLIALPSPIEIHPDHLALSRAFCDLVQRDPMLFADLAVTRVAFYEVSQPVRPNALVDITDVAERKYAAIGEHRSQVSLRDYAAFARGLNTYRAMTLPPGVTFAEAYYVVDLASLRTTSFSELQRMTGTARDIEITREPLPISVILRTKDRPALLQEALASIRATSYPCELVVVNDGGAKPDAGAATLVNHETSRGRSIAANEGVRAATHPFIAFLDDDDLFHREHLATLATAANGSSSAAWYTDAISAFLRPGPSGGYEAHSRQRLYAQDFDRELLLVDNYIPLPTLLLPRQSFLDLGGFDPDFDLFEDWEFLIRLAQRGDFLHVPRVTVEVRHFEGGGSIVLAAPEGSPRFRDAKQQVWRKHAALLSNEVFANVFERQKRRAGALYSDIVEAKGGLSAARVGEGRFEREKQELIAQLQELHAGTNAHLMRIRELEGAVQAMTATCEQVESLVESLTERATRSEREAAELRAANAQTHAALESARVEITRLNGLLNMILGSRTWKLHNFVERMRGRG